MNKIKYTFISLLLIAVTVLFMIMPDITDSIQSQKSAGSNISDIELNDTEQTYTVQEVFDIIESNNNENAIFIKLSNTKSEDEFMYDCTQICNAMFNSSGEYVFDTKALLDESKNKWFSTMKFTKPYHNKFINMNIIICEFDNCGICYEEHNTLPLFVFIKNLEQAQIASSTSFDYSSLEESMIDYYNRIGLYDLSFSTSGYYDYQAILLGSDIMYMFSESLRQYNDFFYDYAEQDAVMIQ